MAIVEVSIIPIGTETTSVSRYVAEAVQILQKSGMPYQLTPMGTVIEGDIREVMNVILAMHETPFAKSAGRVYTTIKIDDRRDKKTGMQYKVQSVERKLKE